MDLMKQVQVLSDVQFLLTFNVETVAIAMWTLWHTSHLVSMQVHSCHLILMSIQMLILFQLEMPVDHRAKRYQPDVFLIKYLHGTIRNWMILTSLSPCPKSKVHSLAVQKQMLFFFTHSLFLPSAYWMCLWAKQIVLPTWYWYWWSWSVSYFLSGALTLASFPGSPGTQICICGETLASFPGPVHLSLAVRSSFNTWCVWYLTPNS